MKPRLDFFFLLCGHKSDFECKRFVLILRFSSPSALMIDLLREVLVIYAEFRAFLHIKTVYYAQIVTLGNWIFDMIFHSSMNLVALLRTNRLMAIFFDF